MKIKISHQLSYTYSKKVFLEPHTLYLIPRQTSSLSLNKFSIKIDPEPVLQTSIIDADNNSGLKLWFENLHDHLTIQTELDVINNHTNPFDFILDSTFQQIPINPAIPVLNQLIGPKPEKFDPTIEKYSHDIAKRIHYKTLDFLTELTKALHQQIERIIRPDGEPWPPHKTFADKTGSCRDVTLVFMECCRVQRIPARFVSGYFLGDEDVEAKDLHAWPEVYLEGGGWRGFDPSIGVAVADRHIPLAAHFNPASVSPVQGSVRGTGATQKSYFKILMK